MREPKKIDLLRRPRDLSQGDIIGFQKIPSDQSKIISGSSRTIISGFQASPDKPSMRAFVLEIVYDAQDKDRIAGLVLLPMAPHEKKLRIENNDKNLMISQGQYAMGLDNQKNWRLNYTPFFLPVKKENFGLDDAMVMKYGQASHDLAYIIARHASTLGDLNILHTMDVIPRSQLRTSLNTASKAYDRVVGNEVGARTFKGGAEDRRVLEQAEVVKAQALIDQAREQEEARIREKAEAREHAKAEARERQQLMRSTPSGKLAWKNHVAFNESANPDLTFDAAFELQLIDGDQWLNFEEIGAKSGCKTIRTLYDAFKTNHEKILSDMVIVGVTSEENAVLDKASTEQSLKEILIIFYKKLQASTGEQNEELSQKTVPYIIPPSQQPA